MRSLATAEAIVARVMLVGHNPELIDLAHRLLGEITQLPTCAVAAFRFDGSWSAVGKTKPAPVAIDNPRKPQGRPGRGRDRPRTPSQHDEQATGAVRSGRPTLPRAAATQTTDVRMAIPVTPHRPELTVSRHARTDQVRPVAVIRASDDPTAGY